MCGRAVVNYDQQLEQQKNWHHHLAHHAKGSVMLFDKINELKHSTNDFATIYFSTMPASEAAKTLFDISFDRASPEQVLAVQNLMSEDFQTGIRFCQDQDLIPVFFDYTHTDFASMYYNDRYPVDWSNQHQSKQDQLAKYNKTFFANSASHFSHTVWDQRELSALTYRPPGLLSIDVADLIDQTLPHLYYSTDDVWNGFDRCLEEICHIWNLDIDADRFCVWQKIYAQWRTVHDPWFSRHLARILDAVINNKYLSLKRFRMNFFMEVILQHELITKHNLNLKTWQLDRLPDNTQEIYQLLEPNIHKL